MQYENEKRKTQMHDMVWQSVKEKNEQEWEQENMNEDKQLIQHLLTWIQLSGNERERKKERERLANGDLRSVYIFM